MHTVIVVAHPRHESLTWSLARAFARGLFAAGQTSHLVDLYEDGFDPVLRDHEWRTRCADDMLPEVRRHQQLLREASGLALVYPIWWAGPPAMLQGWLQRVLTRGFAFQIHEDKPRGLLHHRVQLIVNVGSRQNPQCECYFKPITDVLKYCGIEEVKRLVNWSISSSMDLASVHQALQQAQISGQCFAERAQPSGRAKTLAVRVKG